MSHCGVHVKQAHAQTYLLAWGVDPRQMRELRVATGANDFAADFTEALCCLRECDDLSWAEPDMRVNQSMKKKLNKRTTQR